MCRYLCRLLFAAVFLVFSGTAFSFALTPANSTVDIGDEIRFSLTGDYADFISFDLSISYDPTVLMPVYVDVNNDFSPDNLDDVGAGSGLLGHNEPSNHVFFDNPGLFNLSFSGFGFDTGSGEIAFFTFEAINAGNSTVSLDGILDPNFGCVAGNDSCLRSLGFSSPDEIQQPIVARAEVTVLPGQSSSVPLPGVLYLMIAGLVTGALVRRRSWSS